MTKHLLGGLILCLAFNTLALAHMEPILELEGRYWMPQLSAEAKVKKEGRGTDVDFKNDLGLSDQSLPYGRISLFTGSNSRLTLTYTGIGYNANTFLNKTVEFGGKTYTVGTRVTTDLDVKYLRFGWAYQFVNLEGGRLKFGTLLEAKGFWGDVSLAAPNLIPPIKESRSFSAVLPTIGLVLELNPLPFLNIFGEISSLPAGQYGYFLDAEVGIKYRLFEILSITGGYRICDLEARDEPDYARVKLSGPFVGFSLRF